MEILKLKINGEYIINEKIYKQSEVVFQNLKMIKEIS